MSNMHRFLPLFGRILIGVPFMLSGFGKLTTYDATAGYIASVGLPLAPVAWACAVATELGGGALLVFGFRARIVAFLVALFTLATAIFFHRNFGDQNQMTHFMKNLIMAGGLLQIAYFGAGPLSLDAARKK